MRAFADNMNSLRKVIAGTQRLGGLDDVDEVLTRLSRLLKRTVKSRWIVVYLLDRERNDFAHARSCGLPKRYQPLFAKLPLAPERIPLLKTLIKKHQHMVITNGQNEQNLPPRLGRLLKGLTILAVPMIVRGQVTGVVFVAREKALMPFSPDEISLIKDVVGHAALVISHINLFDESLDMALEMGRRIDVILTIDEINRTISSSLSHEKIIETALTEIERILQCELVAVLEDEQGRLVVKTAQSASISVPAALARGKSVPDGSLSKRAFMLGESCYRARLSAQKRLVEPDRSLRSAGIESLLAIPIINQEHPSGVLLLGDTDPDQLGRESTFTVEKIAGQMAVALANSHLYEQMRSLFFSTVSSLANAIDAKSPWTKGHSERVMRIASRIAREMGLSEAEVEQVRLAGLLHDIGKIGIIEALLEKPQLLDEEEFPPMRLHPEKGVAILAPIAQLKEILPGVLHHHEYFDGSGYPDGLAGETIPLIARIVTVADSFDAMLSRRPYKKGLSLQEAVNELHRCAGTQFDPEVVRAFTGYIARNTSQSGVSRQT